MTESCGISGIAGREFSEEESASAPEKPEGRHSSQASAPPACLPTYYLLAKVISINVNTVTVKISANAIYK
jgi:hypothetical protein